MGVYSRPMLSVLKTYIAFPSVFAAPLFVRMPLFSFFSFSIYGRLLNVNEAVCGNAPRKFLFRRASRNPPLSARYEGAPPASAGELLLYFCTSASLHYCGIRRIVCVLPHQADLYSGSRFTPWHTPARCGKTAYLFFLPASQGNESQRRKHPRRSRSWRDNNA